MLSIIKKENKKLKRIYTGIGNVVSLNIHPKGEYVLIKKHQSANQKETNFMSYVNVDGYTVSRMARPKVSKNEPNQSLGVFSRSKDTLIWVDFSALSDILDAGSIPRIFVPASLNFFNKYPSLLAISTIKSF